MISTRVLRKNRMHKDRRQASAQVAGDENPTVSDEDVLIWLVTNQNHNDMPMYNDNNDCMTMNNNHDDDIMDSENHVEAATRGVYSLLQGVHLLLGLLNPGGKARGPMTGRPAGGSGWGPTLGPTTGRPLQSR